MSPLVVVAVAGVVTVMVVLVWEIVDAAQRVDGRGWSWRRRWVERRRAR